MSQEGIEHDKEMARLARMVEAYNPPLEPETDWRAVASDAADIVDQKNEEIGQLQEKLRTQIGYAMKLRLEKDTLVDALERIAYHPFAEVRGEMDYEWIAGSMRRLALNALGFSDPGPTPLSR